MQLREQRSSTRNVEAWALVQRGEQVRRAGEAAAARDDTTAMGRDFRAADSLLAAAEELDGKWPDPIVLRGLVAYRRSRFPAWTRPGRPRARSTEGLGHVGGPSRSTPTTPDALEVAGNLQYWSWLLRLEPDTPRPKALLDSAQADLEAATKANPNQAGA